MCEQYDCSLQHRMCFPAGRILHRPGCKRAVLLSDFGGALKAIVRFFNSNLGLGPHNRTLCHWLIFSPIVGRYSPMFPSGYAPNMLFLALVFFLNFKVLVPYSSVPLLSSDINCSDLYYDKILSFVVGRCTLCVPQAFKEL